jgi:hypothetical protein
MPHEYPLGLMRVGSSNDGGYLIAKDSFMVSGLLSPGVGDNSDFELAFAELGIPCFLADNSVDGPPIEHKNFHFIKKHLSYRSSEETISIEDWLLLNEINGDNLFLSMDIEGSEYEVLMGTPKETLKRFRFMTIELHELHKIRSKKNLKRLSEFLGVITENHMVVHIHPNNYSAFFSINGTRLASVVELTLVRLDHQTIEEVFPFKTTLENKLDAPCDPFSKNRKIKFQS